MNASSTSTKQSKYGQTFKKCMKPTNFADRETVHNLGTFWII